MTSPSLSTANRNETTGPSLHEIMLVEIPFPSGTVRMTTHDTPVTAFSNTFSPGYFKDQGAVASIAENMNGTAQKGSVTISGCDPALISACVNDAVHLVNLKVWTGFLDLNGALVDTPLLEFNGYIGAPTLALGQNSGTINITLETLNVLLKRQSPVLSSDSYQQLRFAGDTAFHWVATNPNRRIQVGDKEHRMGYNDRGHGNGDPNAGVGTAGDISGGGGGGGGGGRGGISPTIPFAET